MLIIYKYTDYRMLLTDFYEDQKRNIPGFTYAKFSQKSRLNSPNYMKLVMSGKRNLTVIKIHAFAKGMNLKGKELEFFEALVLYNQSDIELEKDYYYQRLKRIKKDNSNNSIDRKSSGKINRNKNKIALKLLLEGKKQENGILNAQEELNISKVHIERHLESLLQSGELLIAADDTYTLDSSHTMRSEEKGINKVQRDFLEEGLDEARLVFNERYTQNMAKFLSVLFTAEPGKLPLIFTDLREAFELVTQKFEPLPQEKQAVYRAQVQVYRLGKSEL
jgi:uncharacterized protein (TIGR02147 family)